MLLQMPTDDEWAEADMAADEAAGKPLKRTAEEGIRDMERRIASLTKRINDLERHMSEDSEGGFSESAAEAIKSLTEDLTTARARLAEYKLQLEGRN